MTYEEWLASVPLELTDDPLWTMEVYRFAVFASDLAWHESRIWRQGCAGHEDD